MSYPKKHMISPIIISVFRKYELIEISGTEYFAGERWHKGMSGLGSIWPVFGTVGPQEVIHGKQNCESSCENNCAA